MVADRISSGNMTSGTASKAWIQMGQSGTVVGNYKSSLNVRKVVADSTLINIAAQNNVDAAVSIWGHQANVAWGTGMGVSGSYTSTNSFSVLNLSTFSSFSSQIISSMSQVGRLVVSSTAQQI